jgi:hypothetical protein
MLLVIEVASTGVMTGNKKRRRPEQVEVGGPAPAVY